MLIISSSSVLCTPNPRLRIPSLSNRRRRSATRKITTNMSTANAVTDPLTSLGRLLWGSSLPPSPLISTVRFTWSAMWQIMMRQLAPSSSTGSYSRPTSSFPSVPLRYFNFDNNLIDKKLHLYVSFPCPWAHRVLITRALLNLEDFLPVSIAIPGSDGPWEFKPYQTGTEPGIDRAEGRRTLREVYKMRKKGFDGRATVPMLWDTVEKDVVCNESYEIVKFFNEIGKWSGSEIDLVPENLTGEIEKWNRIIYPAVNNGVYRCGFAQSQEAYDRAVEELFSALDKIENHLSASRYLCGDVLTIADVCLFTTLIRFDLVYNGLFKCAKKKLVEYINLHGYTREFYQMPKVAETCNFEAILNGYYGTLFPLNPGAIRPVMPSVCTHEFLSQPHNREILSLTSLS